MENNYTDDQVWYRIVAVLEYILSDITRHQVRLSSPTILHLTIPHAMGLYRRRMTLFPLKTVFRIL